MLRARSFHEANIRRLWERPDLHAKPKTNDAFQVHPGERAKFEIFLGFPIQARHGLLVQLSLTPAKSSGSVPEWEQHCATTFVGFEDQSAAYCLVSQPYIIILSPRLEARQSVLAAEPPSIDHPRTERNSQSLSV